MYRRRAKRGGLARAETNGAMNVNHNAESITAGISAAPYDNRMVLIDGETASAARRAGTGRARAVISGGGNDLAMLLINGMAKTFQADLTTIRHQSAT
jgi:hypothetical protein